VSKVRVSSGSPQSFCEYVDVVIIHRLYAVQGRDTSVRDALSKEKRSGTHRHGIFRCYICGQTNFQWSRFYGVYHKYTTVCVVYAFKGTIRKPKYWAPIIIIFCTALSTRTSCCMWIILKRASTDYKLVVIRKRHSVYIIKEVPTYNEYLGTNKKSIFTKRYHAFLIFNKGKKAISQLID